MWRVLSIVEEMSRSLTDATRYLEEALAAMDEEMTTLQGRLHEDVRSLRAGIAGANLSPGDETTLLTTLDQMEATADSVAQFAHRRNDTAPAAQ